MKSLLFLALVSLVTFNASAQADKSKRPSPPATVSQKLASGATITIDYSQPSVKGRTIGKDVEPMPGKAWRAGANEATVFQADKDVQVEGKALPAGSYSVFMIDNGSNWTVIFNKNAKIWGTEYEKNKSADFLQVTVPAAKAASFTEKLTYTIDAKGKVSLMWGDKQVNFNVK
jgi:hypothetical protein